jgi:hypothetical protein
MSHNSSSVDNDTSLTLTNDVAMEDLFREIIIPFPSSSSESLPVSAFSPAAQIITEAASSCASLPALSMTKSEGMDWEKEVEMQRLLDTLRGVQPEFEDIDFSSALELELCGWEPSSYEIGVI